MSPTALPPLAPRAALRWAVVRSAVRRIAPSTILELGCGRGGFGARLARMGTYTAVEPDETSWQAAHEWITPAGGTVVHGDHLKAPDPGTYDMACAFEVLEHLEDDAGALEEWLPLVRPGGHLVLSVPADPERFGPWDEHVGHYRRYSSEQLGERLAKAGAVDITLRHYAWPLGYALDGIRDRLAVRRSSEVAESSVEERTAGSGRVLQPGARLTGLAVKVGITPFTALQSFSPRKGPGLVAVARRPAA
ncbi:class I SAM-dependent methyltransferase [Phytohabitans flavus]|uniref:class I SAM-dependent methyltransferase n=1 Tax=Phytohabitans flavus TaxID=1076124 RepID=UPI0031EEEC13